MREYGEANLMQIRLMIDNIVLRLKEFMENEARSCSMDFGCVTPLYVYRAWGGSVSIDEITDALKYLKANNYE
jgi:hypothetical protein